MRGAAPSALPVAARRQGRIRTLERMRARGPVRVTVVAAGTPCVHGALVRDPRRRLSAWAVSRPIVEIAGWFVHPQRASPPYKRPVVSKFPTVYGATPRVVRRGGAVE